MPPLLSEVAQLVVNGMMAGAILAVPAIGLTAIYAVLRFPNFALASHATIGAFAGYIANAKLGLPILPSVMVAFLAAGAVGVVTDEAVLKQFRPAGFITTAIASPTEHQRRTHFQIKQTDTRVARIATHSSGESSTRAAPRPKPRLTRPTR